MQKSTRIASHGILESQNAKVDDLKTPTTEFAREIETNPT